MFEYWIELLAKIILMIIVIALGIFAIMPKYNSEDEDNDRND